MYQRIGGLAEGRFPGKLVGYINRSAELDVLVEEMGLRQGRSRNVFEVEEQGRGHSTRFRASS
jgi:acetoin utilization protein AcuB